MLQLGNVMNGIENMNELAIGKILTMLAKPFAAVAGALLALVLSNDIGDDGKIQINRSTIIKFTGAVATSLYGGEAIISYFRLSSLETMAQGFIMLVLAIFGLLLIGIVYRALELLRGKPLGVIVAEIRKAFIAMLGDKN